jgi:hypothetical protein
MRGNNRAGHPLRGVPQEVYVENSPANKKNVHTRADVLRDRTKADWVSILGIAAAGMPQLRAPNTTTSTRHPQGMPDARSAADLIHCTRIRGLTLRVAVVHSALSRQLGLYVLDMVSVMA